MEFQQSEIRIIFKLLVIAIIAMTGSFVVSQLLLPAQFRGGIISRLDEYGGQTYKIEQDLSYLTGQLNKLNKFNEYTEFKILQDELGNITKEVQCLRQDVGFIFRCIND